MAIVEWTLICKSAYFDREHRLTMFDIETDWPVPRPRGTQRLSLVVHLRDKRADERLDPALVVTSPRGDEWLADNVFDFCIEHHANYLLLHMPCISLNEEGLYRFQLTLGSGEPTAIEVFVHANAERPLRACVHGAH